MPRSSAIGLVTCLTMFVPWLYAARAQNDVRAADHRSAAVEKGLAYLARQLRQWTENQQCYSCHNNGDAARVLFEARKLGAEIELSIADQTAGWLRRPDGWKDNAGDDRFADEKLAAIQFGAALVALSKLQLQDDSQPLRRAAELVAEQREEHGGWKLTAAGAIGSPVTLGDSLGTAIAIDLLVQADPQRWSRVIDEARSDLLNSSPKATVDVAGALIGTQPGGTESRKLRSSWIEQLLQRQDRSGGWGPYGQHPPENFDTAIALIALQEHRGDAAVDRTIDRGCTYLVLQQSDDGSWRETTRPDPVESYSHRVSTTAWCTLALLWNGRD